jgi:hypothetical protein
MRRKPGNNFVPNQALPLLAQPAPAQAVVVGVLNVLKYTPCRLLLALPMLDSSTNDFQFSALLKIEFHCRRGIICDWKRN